MDYNRDLKNSLKRKISKLDGEIDEYNYNSTVLATMEKMLQDKRCYEQETDGKNIIARYSNGKGKAEIVFNSKGEVEQYLF